jgi:hypothetical protein
MQKAETGMTVAAAGLAKRVMRLYIMGSTGLIPRRDRFIIAA